MVMNLYDETTYQKKPISNGGNDREEETVSIPS